MHIVEVSSKNKNKYKENEITEYEIMQQKISQCESAIVPVTFEFKRI